MVGGFSDEGSAYLWGLQVNQATQYFYKIALPQLLPLAPGKHIHSISVGGSCSALLTGMMKTKNTLYSVKCVSQFRNISSSFPMNIVSLDAMEAAGVCRTLFVCRFPQLLMFLRPAISLVLVL